MSSRPPLADGTVRFVGDIVAVVVAETRAQAVDAAELVIVDYDPLPVVVDPKRRSPTARRCSSPSTARTSPSSSTSARTPTILDDADVVVQGRFVNQRVAAVPMEANGIVVEPDGDGASRSTCRRQDAVRRARPARAARSASSPAQVRVIAPAVGGGFGAKIGAVPASTSIAAAAAQRSAGR